MKYKIFMIGCLAVAMCFASCKKFLEVSPKSNVSEKELFTSEAGFQQALTGVYSQLAGRNLYGDKLSMGFVSALQQNYSITVNSYIPLVESVKLNYAADEVKTHTAAIWSEAYAAIAGLNKIITNTESNRAVLTASAYGRIRGEALALRAFIHFDLLRLFGPAYASGESLKAIPYTTTVSQIANVPATTAEVINFALADVKEAEDLLIAVDPIVTSDTRTRRNKLNYYGVKALEARILLYSGDKSGAALAAKVVINSGKYTWVTQAEASQVSSSSNTRDRLYFNEQVFMIRVRDMVNWTETYFRYNGSANAKLTRSQANFNTLYETTSGGSTDIRYVYRLEQDGSALFPSKFWQSANTEITDTRKDQYVPGIRWSEMYYILAETAATPAEGVAFLNTVRQNRGLAATTATTEAALRTAITKEYQKEFYAEGQLFFYYKRINASTMQFRSAAMTASQYVLPIPDAELQFNPNYSN